MIHANEDDPTNIEAVSCTISDLFASFYCSVTELMLKGYLKEM